MPDRQPLSPRQAVCLDVIVEHIEANGYPPTYREIASAMGFRSTNAARDHLQALKRKGWIDCGNGESRGIKVPGPTGESAAAMWERRARALGWTDDAVEIKSAKPLRWPQ